MTNAPSVRSAPSTAYFTDLAETYASHRPGYPEGAIDFMLQGVTRPTTVADIGCGTGIATRLLARDGVGVIGIDPNDDMLQHARSANNPSRSAIEYRRGTAEHTGLADSSSELVVCAQAYHWFAEEAALREFHRILRPVGRLALMWNVKDEDDLFTARYLRLTHEAQELAERSGLDVPRGRRADPTMGGMFDYLRCQSFANPHPLDEQSLLGRARSASYFPRTEPARSTMEKDLSSLFAEHQRDGWVTLAQRTEVTLADRAE